MPAYHNTHPGSGRCGEHRRFGRRGGRGMARGRNGGACRDHREDTTSSDFAAPEPRYGGGRRQHRRERGLFGLGRARDETMVPADAAPAPVPTDQPDSVSHPETGTAQAVRLFACVGKDCRQEHDARAVLDALRQQVASIETAGLVMDVQPCGCVDLCEQGPVVVACTGPAAQAAHPPVGNNATGSARPLATFVQVTPDKAGSIIETVLTTLQENLNHA